MANTEAILRPLTENDRHATGELIFSSINVWYANHGCPTMFTCEPQDVEIFFDTYNDLTPGCSIAAEHPETGVLMASCFYHPRESHVSLGIMTVSPNHFGCGLGAKLLQHIIDYTDTNGFPALRLTQSAINVDSFSLYNKYGFVPRYSYQDMIFNVPENGLNVSHPGRDRVRPATLDDVDAIAAVEQEVSGLSRKPDYRYCIENARGLWRTSVIESNGGDIDGFLMSSNHPASNMLGPGVSRTQDDAAALIAAELDHHKGRMPVAVIPMEKTKLVRQMYAWGARNCEMHFCQVRGEFQPFNGVNMPAFLPESA
jgi:GNAT superfamily N-acetyltransferase